MRVTPSMVLHQCALMGTTLRRLLRDPRVGGEFRRLVETRGRSTMALRLPWLPFRLIDDLSTVVTEGSKVFEYGGGGSTLWFLDRGATVVTVEHDPDWSALLRETCSSGQWTLLERSLASDTRTYVESITAFEDESFDVVVVDGRERARCVLAAAPKIRPGGWLVVDDCDRDRYAEAIASVGWPCTEFVGFAPAKPTLAYTAVLTKPLHPG